MWGAPGASRMTGTHRKDVLPSAAFSCCRSANLWMLQGARGGTGGLGRYAEGVMLGCHPSQPPLQSTGTHAGPSSTAVRPASSVQPARLRSLVVAQKVVARCDWRRSPLTTRTPGAVLVPNGKHTLQNRKRGNSGL